MWTSDWIHTKKTHKSWQQWTFYRFFSIFNGMFVDLCNTSLLIHRHKSISQNNQYFTISCFTGCHGNMIDGTVFYDALMMSACDWCCLHCCHFCMRIKNPLPWSAAARAPLCSVRRPRESSWGTPTLTRWCCSPHSAISADSGLSGPAQASVDPRAYTCPSQSLTHASHDHGKGSQSYNYLLPRHASSDGVDGNTGQSFPQSSNALNDRHYPKNLSSLHCQDKDLPAWLHIKPHLTTEPAKANPCTVLMNIKKILASFTINYRTCKAIKL